jgi:hypothetical protein
MIKDFLKNFLTKWVDNFKVKNPQIFVLIQGLLMAMIFTLGSYLTSGQIKEIEFTVPIIGTVLPVFKTILGALIFLSGMFGAHTPKSTPPIALGKYAEIDSPEKVDA